MVVSNEKHEKELSNLHKKAEQRREEVEALEMKVKWAQNKLKVELDSHKVKLTYFIFRHVCYMYTLFILLLHHNRYAHSITTYSH